MSLPDCDSAEASVVIPSFNDTEYLNRCLEGLSDQTIRNRLEIIISLDGFISVPAYVKEKADMVLEGPHGGPAVARNRGWRAANGEFVLFTDSDCIPDRHWAERMLYCLKEGADAVKGVYSRGGDTSIQRLAQIEFEERYSLLLRNTSIDLVATYSAGYRKDVLEELDGFDESFPLPDHEDVDLSYRMASRGKVMKFVPDASVEHEHRRTWAQYFRMKFSRGKWRLKVLRSFPEKAGRDSYTPINLKIQIALCLLIPAIIPLIFLVNAAFGLTWAAVFLLSTLPIIATGLRKDPFLVPLLPFFVLWRGCALSSGLMWGIFSAGKGDE